MDDRLVPILAAAVGVVGGVGGALVGGVLTNESQERQAERDRAAAVQDMRIDAYSNFLGSAQSLADVLNARHSEQERDARGAEVLVAQSRVAILHETQGVLDRAYDVMVALSKGQAKKYKDAAAAFREEARAEIAATGAEED